MRCSFLCLLLVFIVNYGFAELPATKVGFILPLSGEWAFLGNGIRDGALLAQKDLTSSGSSIQLFFEDNHGELSQTSRLAEKLVRIDKVGAIVSIISGVGSILKPLAQRSTFIHVGICSEPEVADGKFSFVNYLTAEQGVAKYLKHFHSVFGSKGTLVIFSMNESGFQRITDEIRKKIDSQKHILDVFSYNKGTTDFRSMLLRAASKKPNAFLILGLSPEIEILAHQAHTLSIGIPFTSIEGFGLARDKAPFEGSWFIDSAVPQKEFRDRFHAVYGYEVTPGVGHAYDTVKLLSTAFEKAATNKDAAQKFGTLADIKGVTGTLNVRSDGIVWSDASAKIIRNGKAEIIDSP